MSSVFIAASVVLLCVFSFPVLNVSADCFYLGKWYKSAPEVAVVGERLTCYCSGSSWVNCTENPKDDKEKSLLTALGRRSKFDAKDFVFDLAGSMPISKGSAGVIQALEVGVLPALAGGGLAYTLFNIEPCGINLPHHHPRASEMLYVIKGEKLRVGFVEENLGRALVNDISTGKVMFIPEGLLHYQQNLSCEKATYISATNSEDPGVITSTTQLFLLPTMAVAGSLGVDEGTASSLGAGLSETPAEGRIECLKKCSW